jgi:hypothetical protein
MQDSTKQLIDARLARLAEQDIPNATQRLMLANAEVATALAAVNALKHEQAELQRDQNRSNWR